MLERVLTAFPHEYTHSPQSMMLSLHLHAGPHRTFYMALHIHMQLYSCMVQLLGADLGNATFTGILIS